jgi:hypothetical protein
MLRDFVLTVAGCATVAALTVFVLLNLILGCGETIYTAAGPVPGECFIINQ